MGDETPQSTDRAARRRLAELIGGYQASAAIGALARLGVADALAQGPRSVADVARAVGAGEDALARLLAATLDLGLFAFDDEGRCALSDVGALLCSDAPGSMRRFAVVSTEQWRWAAYGHLDHALRSGEPGFVAAHGCRLWDYLAGHPEAAASFAESMDRVGAARDRAVAASVDMSAVGRVVDVGGGRGGLVIALLTANPQLRGVVFDLPAVAEDARERLRSAGLAGRCDVVAGDFRDAVVPDGDVYLLSWILHDWDDAGAVRVLRNCREAMVPGARLLVVEMVVPEPDQTGAEAFQRLVRQADLEMLAVVGGRERTKAEYERLFVDAGLVLDRVTPLQGMPWSVIEGRAI